VSTPAPESGSVPESSAVPESGSVAESSSVARRPSKVFLALAGLVIIAAVAIRLVFLGRQSYWVDELFSVNQTSGRFESLLRLGSTEVHTPFYAGLLWGWIKVFGPHTVGTRLLSTVFAIVSVVVSYRGLRPVPIGEHTRWALTVATAASGTSIVYSLETRSYALLMLGSVGLTVWTLRAALLILNREPLPVRIVLGWVGWAALAATAHLFGAVLALAAMAVLVVLTSARVDQGKIKGMLTWVLAAGLGCAPQGLWILVGLGRPGFAEGTDWIQAPDRSDLRDLVTTTFSSGAITPHKDGFAWASPIGVVVIAVLGLAAVLHGFRSRSRTRQATDGRSAEAAAALVLLALALLVIVTTFAVSQHTHLWTLRNLVIVAPALAWGAICLVVAAARTAEGRRTVAGLVVALLGIGLVPISIGLGQPYKTDFRGLMNYLVSVRAEQPDTAYVFIGRDQPGPWRTASERDAGDPVWATVYQDDILYRGVNTYLKQMHKDAGPRVVIYNHGVANPRLDQEAATLVTRLGPSGCRRIPIYGLIVVHCD
jgi:uncharacterized membrane protein